MSSRNNKARVRQPSTSADDLPEENIQQPQSPGLNFTVPTEFVDLPSRGLYYPKSHPLCGVDSIEMKHMTAKEEDILASQSLIKKGVTIERLLESLIVDESVQIRDLLVGDRNAITVAARISGYGAEYKTKFPCPACAIENDFSFDLLDAAIVGAGHNAEDLNNDLENVEVTDKGTFIVTLPKSGHAVEIRLMTGVDEENLETFRKRKEKKGLPESFLTDTLKAIVVGVDGVEDRDLIGKFVDVMPALDSKFLRGVYVELIPNIDMTQEFHCSSCDHQQDLEVPVTAEFFWPRQ
jgi:hypothetical protein